MQKTVFRLHLPEWRDYEAVTREVVAALNLGTSLVHLTGARGERLLLSGIEGNWHASIRIDGNAGTEFCRAMNSPNLVVYLNGDCGSGPGFGLKSGTVVIGGKAGALVGSQIEGGQIWCLGPAGPRLAHRSRGGMIVVGNALGPLAMDRRISGTLRIQRYPNESTEATAIRDRINQMMQPAGDN